MLRKASRHLCSKDRTERTRKFPSLLGRTSHLGFLGDMVILLSNPYHASPLEMTNVAGLVSCCRASELHTIHVFQVVTQGDAIAFFAIRQFSTRAAFRNCIISANDMLCPCQVPITRCGATFDLSIRQRKPNAPCISFNNACPPCICLPRCKSQSGHPMTLPLPSSIDTIIVGRYPHRHFPLNARLPRLTESRKWPVCTDHLLHPPWQHSYLRLMPSAPGEPLGCQNQRQP